jgi:hypothetical protein
VPPPVLDGAITTDLAHHKRCDQMLCLPRAKTRFTSRARSVDFYPRDHHELFPHHRVSKTAFSFELSDHLPLWAELRTRVAQRTSCGVISRAGLKREPRCSRDSSGARRSEQSLAQDANDERLDAIRVPLRKQSSRVDLHCVFRDTEVRRELALLLARFNPS